MLLPSLATNHLFLVSLIWYYTVILWYDTIMGINVLSKHMKPRWFLTSCVFNVPRAKYATNNSMQQLSYDWVYPRPKTSFLFWSWWFPLFWAVCLHQCTLLLLMRKIFSICSRKTRLSSLDLKISRLDVDYGLKNAFQPNWSVEPSQERFKKIPPRFLTLLNRKTQIYFFSILGFSDCFMNMIKFFGTLMENNRCIGMKYDISKRKTLSLW